MKALLDTHVWIWWLTGQPDLPDRERTALDALAEKEVPCISAISLWEAQMLHSKDRLSLDTPFENWLLLAAASDTVTVLPITAEIVIEVNRLPARFHGDPADRIITATAITAQLPLATHDRNIRRSRLARLWHPKKSRT